MPSAKSNFLDKALGHIGRLDKEGLETVVQRLASERELLETLFHTIEDGVLVVNPQGRITYGNAAASRLIGIPEDSGEEEPISRYFPELDWERLLAMDVAGQARIARHELEIQFPRQRFLRLYAAPLDGASPGSRGLALILQDATEDRQKTFEALESERLRALTLLAGSVAHEIGNPLNALHIHLQLMERELNKMKSVIVDVDESEADDTELTSGGLCDRSLNRFEQYLDVCKGEIRRLDYIVTQFLQAIRPTEPKLKTGSLNEVVQETINLLMPEIENRGQKLVKKLDAGLQSSVFDPVQIKQVLVNLIKNAMQAMSRSGVITVETGSRAEGVWVEIRDTGPGIPQEKINRIFEPFYTTKEKGSGLGLMLVQRIIREHNGRIEMESPENQGTRFRIWLPLESPQPRLLKAARHE